jgi:hypothetical protein
MSRRRNIAVIGLGYVGLPVAAAFARAGNPVVGFDIDQARIAELKAGHDRTREVETSELTLSSLDFTSEAAAIHVPDFFIVTVQTPIDSSRRPDLGAMLAASRTVGAALKSGGHRCLRIGRLSWCRRRGMRADPRAIIGSQGRLRFQCRLFDGTGLVLDVKMKLDRGSRPAGIELWRP